MVSASGTVFVAVTNGITIISLNTLACRQVAGAWWTFFGSGGLMDGGLGYETVEPVSRLSLPFKLAMDEARGILYTSDYDSGALRRVFVDGRCRCAEGSIFLPRAQACYNPTPVWDASLPLVACPPGQFALEGDAVCHPCAEAATYGMVASVCLLWQALQAQSQQQQQLGAFFGTGRGFAYTRVLAMPEPWGAIAADWYPDAQSAAGQPPSWDDIFRTDSPVLYQLGGSPGRAPWGGEFLTLTFEPAAGLWGVERRGALQPRRILPGFWHPCGVAAAGPDGRFTCSCSTVPAAFAGSNGTGGGMARWHEVRLAAFRGGGRILGGGGGGGVRLADFAGGGGRTGTADASTEVCLWSRFMLLGTDAFMPQLCLGLLAPSQQHGPCFPQMVHYQSIQPPTLEQVQQRSATPQTLQLSAGASAVLLSPPACVTGWPAHYSCPEGYTWVGPNTSALGAGQLLPAEEGGGSFWKGQVACLSCLPGSYTRAPRTGSSSEADRLRLGGPYTCTACLYGAYASAVASTGCVLCPAGSFADAPASTQCQACPLNHYTQAGGATDGGMCSPCAPGTGSCTDCVQGQFQDQAAQSQCHYCPPGTFSNHSNSTACTACAVGTFQPLAGMARCQRCDALHYTPPDVGGGGATACVACAAPGCALVVGGECGRGCGLNYYYDVQTQPTPPNPCVRCAPGSLNAYDHCAQSPDACWQPPPGLYLAEARPPGGGAAGGDVLRACPAGSGPNAARDGCTPCAAGLFSTEGSGCMPCAGGGYSAAASNSTACARCAPGTFTPPLLSLNNNNGCLLPDAVAQGRCNAQGRTACLACDNGTFAAVAGAWGCTPCQAGAYASARGAQGCALCAAGTYGTANGSATPCTQRCDAGAGQYSGRGSSACVYCTGGLVNATSSQCVGCGLGRYEQTFADGSRWCQTCPAGLAQLWTQFARNASMCTPCPLPTIQYAPPQLEGRACVEVDLGHYVAQSGVGFLLNQTACPAGTFRGNGSLGCAACPPGAWSGEGAAACARCPPGKFRGAADHHACYACAEGTVAADAGASACTPCPGGTEASHSGTACEPCLANAYSLDGMEACQACSGGLTSKPGATACGACPPFSVLIAGRCDVCPAGYYMREVWEEGSPASTFFCRGCPAGTHNARAGGTSAAACIACASPRYVPNRADGTASQCVPCPPGSASDDGVACAPCAPGNYSAQGLGCARCAPGAFAGTTGATACPGCPPGAYMAQAGATACPLCPPGTFSNGSRATGCTQCAPTTFAPSAGATVCRGRTHACAVGHFVAEHQGDPARDNECVLCQACQPDEYMATTATSAWTSLSFVAGSANEWQPADVCPGTTTAPSYRCISSQWPAGQYITPAGLAGLSPLEGLTSLKVAQCTDLLVVEGDFLSAAAATLMDYVRGRSFECYIGCRYALNDSAVGAYVRAMARDETSLEDPFGNVFLPHDARPYAAQLCLPCRTDAPACHAGAFRPESAPGCGPPCLSRPALCPGPAHANGCTGACAPPPDHAVFIGGSAVLGLAQCPWACLGRSALGVVKEEEEEAGYHLRDDGSGCESCAATHLCDATEVHVPETLCFPYSRTRDVCRPCPPVVGGIPSGWVLLDASNASAGGRCRFACSVGYYPLDPEATDCVACTARNGIPCPVGTFRDVAACWRDGQAPVCAPCTAPADLLTPERYITFHSAGVPVDADSCRGLCNTGFHTIQRPLSQGGAGAFAAVVYVADNDLSERSRVWNISCRPCRFADTVPCHGACSPGHFRDTQAGTCARCTVNADCETGHYAPLCLGNGTGNVGCLPCDRARLGEGKTRVFVPYAALAGPAQQQGLIAAAWEDGFACPTVCEVNHVLVEGQCVPCRTTTATTTTTTTPFLLDAQQPRPSDFVFAHWDASPGRMWWSPSYTPPFLRGLRPRASDGLYLRAGLCWACPVGRGTAVGMTDLCQLLPGFGTTEQGVIEARVPIPTLGSDLLLVLDEPLPALPDFALPPDYLTNAQIGASAGRRRVLLTLSTGGGRRRLTQQQPEQEEAALVPTSVGYYNDGRSPMAMGCPTGTSTRTTGSTHIGQCECLPGHFNVSGTAAGGCTPCPPDTFRSPLMPSGASQVWNAGEKEKGRWCTPCPPLETTFDRTAQSACACRGGHMRRSNGSCALCLPGYFCTPCFHEQRQTGACPAGTGGGWITPCMQGGTSPPGSTSLLNCTCRAQARLLRPWATVESIQLPTLVPPSNRAMYCLEAPPNSVYDPQTLTLRCKTGWNTEWVSPSSSHSSHDVARIRGCFLCREGRFAERDPSSSSASDEGVLSLVCRACPLGTFMDRTDAIGGCTPCPLNLTTVREGATSPLDCGCPAGTSRDPVTQRCTGCPLGQYPTPDRLGCIACKAGMTSKLNPLNSSDCLCPAGALQLPGDQLCAPCPPGTYSSRGGVTVCTSCGPNRQTVGGGHTSASACACAPGFDLVAGVLCRNHSLLLLLTQPAP